MQHRRRLDGGRSVAVTNEGSDTLSLVDLTSGTVRTVAVGRAPRRAIIASKNARCAQSASAKSVPAGKDLAVAK